MKNHGVGKMVRKKESEFQKDLMDEIKSIFPGCIVLKNDCNYIQGIPDWTIFYKNKWAVLEAKRSENESHRPNQDYYINLMNNMSFARFVYPENRNEVISDLKRYFKRR